MNTLPLAKTSRLLGIARLFPAEEATYCLTLLLLVPTLLIGFLRLELGDGTYDFTVAQRYLSGEWIYRNFEVYTTPLSIYWNALLLRLFPTSVATISIATLVSCSLMGILLAYVVYRETYQNRSLSTLFLASTMYLSVYHWPRASYSWHALLLSTFAIVILVHSPAWTDIYRNDVPRFILIGLVVGAAIGTKQNIGILILMACLGWVVDRELLSPHASIRRMSSHLLALLGGASAIPAAIGLNLYRQGDLSAFAEIMDKLSRFYFEALSISYFSNFTSPDTLRGFPIWVLVHSTLVMLLIGAVVSVLFIVCPLIAQSGWHLLQIGRCSVIGSDPRMRFWAILYLASFMVIFPRADYFHVIFSIPFCFAAMAILLDRWFRSASGHVPYHGFRRVSIVVCLIYSALMTVHVVNFAIQYSKGERVMFLEFPARGMIATPETVQFVNEVRGRIRHNLSRGANLVIAHPFACFFYPFLDASNPTRFTYFFDGILNQKDLHAITSAIDEGRISAMLIQVPQAGFSPFLLYSYATQRMDLRSSIRDFHLFVRKGERADDLASLRYPLGGGVIERSP